MNLHGIVRPAINRVNPDIPATLLQSGGAYTTAADGKRTPLFNVSTGSIQVQGVSGKDLEHLSSLNIQGVVRLVFLHGNWCGVVRADQKGGDILKFPEVPGGDVRDWKVVLNKETWPDWSSVFVVLQSEIIPLPVEDA